MKLPSIDKYKTATSKHKHRWQESAEEISEWFGVKLYWLFWKFNGDEIVGQYKYLKGLGSKDSQKLIKFLKRKV